MIALSSSQSLADVAYEAVVEAILDKRFAAGERITIDQVARDLQMSTTPVREALTRASANRLLVQSRNRGFAVAALPGPTGYHQLFAVRRLLETYGAQTAQPAPDDLDGLARIHAAMRAMEPSADYAMYRRFNQLDQAFHQRVVALARNPLLDDAWASLHFHLQMSRLYAGHGVIDESDAVEEHGRILEALRGGVCDTAADLVRDHIDAAEARLLPLLAGDDPATQDGAHCFSAAQRGHELSSSRRSR